MERRYIAVEAACAEVDKGDLLVGNNAEWAKEIICRTPAADVVGKSVYEQIKWERDVAMGQLEDAGIPFGGKADVAVVKHGKWLPTNTPSYFGGIIYKCSECDAQDGEHSSILGAYCWRCGAKMYRGVGNG